MSTQADMFPVQTVAARQLRPYQSEFVSAALASLVEFDRVLGVAATGAGKTVMAGELARLSLALGPVLFLADAKQLVWQAAKSLTNWTGERAAVEMADSHAQLGDRIVVATTQSIARRLKGWPANYFALIIVDEAHRNTLGAQAQSVLSHFTAAQVIGITATPFRSDKQQLGSYYQTIADCDAGLIRLINEGWLSRITIKSVPAPAIDFTKIRTVKGDFADTDLGAALDPHIDTLARIVAEHARERRTVAFLPLRETSRNFVAACKSIGLRAVHVDGDDRAGLDAFARRDYDIISNASLLTTGWDQPDVDCVSIFRPTKSFVLYSQMVGRGTRIHPGKSDLLLLDPLYLSETGLGLIRPSRLIARTAEEAADIETHLAEGEQIDLFDAAARGVADREKRMREKLAEAAKKKARTVDAIEFALSIGDDALAGYEPTLGWEMLAPTKGQLAALEKMGFAPETITSKGLASQIFDRLSARRIHGLATPKQLRWLIHMGHPRPATATFEEATAFLDAKWGKKEKQLVSTTS
ncbi:DNA/RNA helicase, superfamily II [Opitutaceae bacterium TAV1]|nr:DNA/RNA helicase, superfamily II [Opitutaceae bacterium TAV1]